MSQFRYAASQPCFASRLRSIVSLEDEYEQIIRMLVSMMANADKWTL
jgi:hypothetical protein